VLAALRSAASTAGRGLAVVAQLELVLAGAVLLVLAGLLLARETRRWRSRHRPHSDEVRARAMMGELCPNGWHAQVTLYGSPTDRAAGAAIEFGEARGPGAAVSIDWGELPGDGGESPPTRRVWAPTIVDGLAAMVEDRRTDEVLERIERSAGADDDPWDAL
jgi:hypothetical protein